MSTNSVFYYTDGTTSTSSDTVISQTSYNRSKPLQTASIGTNVTSLGIGCFQSCTSLTSITIPSIVTSLGNNCFDNCTSLASIIIPSSVASLGDSCFYNCNSLTSITIPSNVTSLGNNCFDNCISLTSIIFTNQSSLTTIGTDTFVNVPETLQVIYLLTSGYDSLSTASKNLQTQMPLNTTYSYYVNSDSVFVYTDGTTSTSSDTVISSVSYDRNKTLQSAIIGTIVTNLGNFCFSECTSLTSITIPISVTNIGTSCFNNCNSLTNITLPSSVTSLGNSCFFNCSSLKSITIPSSVTFTILGTSFFRGCSSLTSITIPSSVTRLGNSCFSNCTSLTSIIFTNQSSLTTIGLSTFVNVPATLQVTYLSTSGYDSLSTASKNLQTQMPSTTTYIYDSPIIPTIISVPNNNIVKTLGDVSFNLYATSNNPSQINYESSDDSIASVNENGVVNVNSVGTCAITVSQPSTNIYSSGTIIVTITVNPNTPSNPVIIDNGIGIEYFLNSSSQYGAIENNIVVTQSLINGVDVNKIIVNNDPNMSLIKILIEID